MIDDSVVLGALEADEPDYSIALDLSETQVVALTAAVRGDDPARAAKAAWLAAFSGERDRDNQAAVRVVEAAARSSSSEVRLAAAGAARQLELVVRSQELETVLAQLCDDRDLDVRRVAREAVGDGKAYGDARDAKDPHGGGMEANPLVSSSRKVRVAIVGIGNCASALVQGIEYYRCADPSETVPGLMHVSLGGYHVRDVEIVAAFDVDAAKVGLDLGKAIFAGPNNTIRIARVGELGVIVGRGPTLDGLGDYYRNSIEESLVEAIDIAAELRATKADVLVSYVPAGSDQAQKHYAVACLEAGVAFINAVPVFIASDSAWAQRFSDAGVPIIGDDIKTQLGSSIVHRVLARLFEDRGLVLDRTYQLNVGGNMNFKNMLERERLVSKRISKTQAVTSQLDRSMAPDDVHIGPTDHVPWLEDRKWAFIRLEGRNFCDIPLNLELKLEVWDAPNSAGVVIDAIRCAKLALDRNIGGPLLGPSAYFMNSPPQQYSDESARSLTEKFIVDEGIADLG